jgi:hypothetical protein
VTAINIHKANISTKPSAKDLNPKNNNDQRMLRINCNPKIINAFLGDDFLLFIRQTLYAANPIKKNRIVHTGPNNQLGGVKYGLFRNTYQVGIFGIVKTDPIDPIKIDPIVNIPDSRKLNFRIYL